LFLAGNTVAMVTCWVTKIITCSSITRQFFDTMIVSIIECKEWVIMNHQNLTAGNFFEAPLTCLMRKAMAVHVRVRYIMLKNLSITCDAFERHF